MRPGDEFIKAYNEVCEFLRAKTGLSKEVPFYQLVDIASKKYLAIGRRANLLKSMGDLRNAIVHHRCYPEVVIADPRPEIIEQLKQILESIRAPIRVIPLFQKEIKLFAVEDHLSEALAHMHDNDFSQIVVQVRSEFRILSAEGIMGWLRTACADGIADTGSATIGDAYRFEDEKAHRYMPRNATVDAAISAFEHALAEGVPRLQAILITNSGRATEKPMGIITTWDLLRYAGNNDMA